MRRLALLASLLLLAATPVFSSAPAWRADAIPGHHSATLSGWTLTIDSARARLVSAIPPGGAPGDNILLAGGHRVWLGPQSEWPVFWPPPKDWEDSPATSLTLSADATEISLALPRTDARHPALVRRYRLLPDALVLVAAWRIEKSDTATAPPARQAVQILQTRADTLVFLAPRPTAAAPLGHGLLALADRPGTDLASALPPGLATPAGPDGLLRLAFTGFEEKIGVPPQPLVARFPGGHGLRLLPATTHDALPDRACPPPEAGLLTQAYFGATAWAMVELEQLSPRLLPAREDGWIESSVRLEFLPPPARE